MVEREIVGHVTTGPDAAGNAGFYLSTLATNIRQGADMAPSSHSPMCDAPASAGDRFAHDVDADVRGDVGVQHDRHRMLADELQRARRHADHRLLDFDAL